MIIKKSQVNGMVERAHQVIYKIIDTEDIDNKVFDYIDPW